MFHLLFLVSSVCIVVGFAGEIHFPRTLYRSHPLRGAYRAFSPGGNTVSFHIPGIMRKPFTLIELLVVIAIIAIVIASKTGFFLQFSAIFAFKAL